jgi:hypothetical protein
MYKLEIGNKVYLNKNSGFPTRMNNPTIGSKYECVGVVVEVDRDSELKVRVEWENGTQNVYKDEHLIKKDYNINSIW